MSKKVEFIFDVASPNGYLSNTVLKDICAKAGAELVYTPCLLGGIFKLTNNQAPMIAFANVKNKLDYQNLEIQRFVKKHALTKYKINPHFPVTTVMVMRGAIVADMEGFVEDYADALTAAMWEQGLKLDDADVLAKAYADAGFDAEHLMARIQDDDVKTKLIENTSNAVERGVFGIPSFFVTTPTCDGEFYYGKDSLDAIAEALA